MPTHQNSTTETSLMTPTVCQLCQIGWSVTWRYGVVALVFWGLYCILYSLEVGFIMSFSQFMHTLQSTLASSGYWATLSLYSRELFMWTLAKSLLGFLITYGIFTSIVKLKYKNFKLATTAQSVEKKCPFKKDVFYIAWDFYWRLYVSMFILSLLSFYFIKPEIWGTNFASLYFGYIFITFIVLVVIIKMILNKNMKKYSLLICQN